jgi:hypothetical protein
MSKYYYFNSGGEVGGWRCDGFFVRVPGGADVLRDLRKIVLTTILGFI